MFGKEKPKPAPVNVEGLHVGVMDSYHEEKKTFRMSEDEFVKFVLKQDGGHIKDIRHNTLEDIVEVDWYRLSENSEWKKVEPNV